MSFGKKVEGALEGVLFASRWLLAPFFLALILCLVALLIKACQHVLHLMGTVLVASETSVVLDSLSLIDLSFCGALVVLVIFSGYENFVSRIDRAGESDEAAAHAVAAQASWPEWMRSIDFNGLKLKLMSSIVAISAIQTLRVMLDMQNRSNQEIAWNVGIHLSFVVSAVLLALMDRISSHEDKH
ncbi:hypothetical protein CCR94_10670 [Rhodoblastus sphagnicola]|uniref:UPF0114 protein CCR94_10670 n=1 Tax=Rhodoblastus sphagnicola TaxID=333368 RepID=A0A2S6N8J2_9HYPH|nr:TIGR00645 family protein [Rhodoblastus sphagnicola]MBB4199912.1 uncharacterized protein (TIGR00645 family) [Rhodoblastus sphagnicola]PPQ30936.1 hypothetical protein CCR94_10670 [Rhodoblastus sphagnicola]